MNKLIQMSSEEFEDHIQKAYIEGAHYVQENILNSIEKKLSTNNINNMSNQKLYYRVKEASELVGIGTSTIWNYAKQGRLKPYKVSDRITVFKKEDLLNLITN